MMRKGFTLIELLVVIAIIAILAAILFPVFMKARTAAVTQKCQSHGRELGIAMSMYADDNNGRFPSSATSDMLAKFTHITWHYRWPAYDESHQHDWSVGGQNQFAYIQLAPYVRNTQIWRCPQPESWYAMKYAYGYRNSWFFVTTNYWSDYPDTPFQDDKGVGRTVAQVLAMDIGDWRRYTAPSRKIWAWCVSMGDAFRVQAYVGGPVITPAYPHGEGSIYVYVDGHARWRETGQGWASVGYTSHRVDTPHKRRP
jgi:prepilin-type N-terminal cleavage/methylation domain-containing protein/prepilin-type processing-associated H-X9-DG protein